MAVCGLQYRSSFPGNGRNFSLCRNYKP